MHDAVASTAAAWYRPRVVSIGPLPRSEPRRTRFFTVAAALVVFALVRFVWWEPRFINASEADTLEAGIGLVQALTDESPPGDARGLTQRLRLGFETQATHPRLDDIPADMTAKRAVLEAPTPRWLAALGIGLWPFAATASNGVRAGTGSALALAFAVFLLAGLSGARDRVGTMLLAPAMLLVMPGVLDAGVAAGYGAAAILVMAALVRTVDRLVATARGALLAALLVGLACGIHPTGVFLVVPVFVDYAVQRAPNADPLPPSQPASLRLPGAPLGLLVLPIVAVLVLVASWPALWNETGKRLGAWLLEYGFYFNAPSEVGGTLFNQHVTRATPAWTALVQWVAWTPPPVLALWVAGVVKALYQGRQGRWFPIATALTFLLVGAMDGSLFGARWSLLPLLWVPTAVTAADGARLALDWVRARWGGASRGMVLSSAGAVMALPIVQALTVSPLGLASDSGSELQFALPMATLDRIVEDEPGATVAIVDGPPQEYVPQIDAAFAHYDKAIHVADPKDARWLVNVQVGPDARARELGDMVMVDSRSGVPVVLWRKPAASPSR